MLEIFVTPDYPVLKKSSKITAVLTSISSTTAISTPSPQTYTNAKIAFSAGINASSAMASITLEGGFKIVVMVSVLICMILLTLGLALVWRWFGYGCGCCKKKNFLCASGSNILGDLASLPARTRLQPVPALPAAAPANKILAPILQAPASVARTQQALNNQGFASAQERVGKRRQYSGPPQTPQRNISSIGSKIPANFSEQHGLFQKIRKK